MPESKAKHQPSFAELMLDQMGVDRTGLRHGEAKDLMLHVIESESEPPLGDPALQTPTLEPTAAEPDIPQPAPGQPMFIADPQKVADFKRTLRARRSPRCRHRKVNGIRCGSPARGGGSYCYFHYHIYTGDTQHLPVIEDGNSIAFVMGMILRDLANGRLEVRRANSMLYALQSTAALLKYLDFEPDPALLQQDEDEDDEDESPDPPLPSALTAFAQGVNRKA